MWKKVHRYEKFTVTSNAFKVHITGGSVIIESNVTGEELKRHKGYNYLYTGDISPDEKWLFALENGKHFFVYSLDTLEEIVRVTLPRGYESIDVNGFYSDEGKILNIPAHKWVKGKTENTGSYEHVICMYETENYTLINKVPAKRWKTYEWVIENEKEYWKDC